MELMKNQAVSFESSKTTWTCGSFWKN